MNFKKLNLILFSKFICVIFIFTPINVKAEWILFFEGKDSSHWYDDKNIKKDNGNFILWERSRNGESHEMVKKFGSKANLYYVKLECKNNTFQILQQTYFSDAEWETEIAENTSPSEENSFKEGSKMHSLSKIICENESL